MATDWGAIAGAAVSLYNGNQAAKAAKQGGEQAAAGSMASNDLLREFYNRDEARQQPFYQAGLTAQNQYMAMLGLGGSQQPAQGGSLAQQYGAYQTPQYAGGSQNYVTEGEGGMPSPNAQLYASNPQYKAAWDQTLQQHRDQWKGNGYHAGSDNDWISERIGQRMPSMQASGGQYGATGGAAGGAAAPAMSQNDAFAAFRNTPGYQFGMDEGNKSVQASAAARGGLNSGATLKALQRYGNDYADQQGYTPYMNKLAGLFGGAQTAAGQMGSAGQSYGGAMGQNLQQAGQARGQSTYDAANAKQQGYGQAAYFGGKAYQNSGWGGI